MESNDENALIACTLIRAAIMQANWDEAHDKFLESLRLINVLQDYLESSIKLKELIA